MTSPLERLTGTGKPLAAEPPDAKEFEGLKRSGLARLKDATNAANSLESRFDLAYNAAHALSLAALRRKGFRPHQRDIVFQVLPFIHSASVLRSGVCWTSATRFGIWVNTKVTSISMSASLPI